MCVESYLLQRRPFDVSCMVPGKLASTSYSLPSSSTTPMEVDMLGALKTGKSKGKGKGKNKSKTDVTPGGEQLGVFQGLCDFCGLPGHKIRDCAEMQEASRQAKLKHAQEADSTSWKKNSVTTTMCFIGVKP